MHAKSREYKITYVKQITLKVQMSPSPPKHHKLITQARDKSMRPSTSGWSKLTSRKYVCWQMLQVSLSFPPLSLSGTSCNVQYRCTIYRCTI
jgi:hypothetical protein